MDKCWFGVMPLDFLKSLNQKFVRQYLKGAELLRQGVRQYVQEVKNGDFPNQHESY